MDFSKRFVELVDDKRFRVAGLATAGLLMLVGVIFVNISPGPVDDVRRPVAQPQTQQQLAGQIQSMPKSRLEPSAIALPRLPPAATVARRR